MKKIITIFIIGMSFPLSSMNRLITMNGPYNSCAKVNSIKCYKNKVDRHRVDKRSFFKEIPKQFIKPVPEKTLEIIRIEKEYRECYGPNFYVSSSVFISAISGAVFCAASLQCQHTAASVLQCHHTAAAVAAGVGVCVIGHVLVFSYISYSGKLYKAEIKRKIASIAVPQLPQRKKLNCSIEESNRNLATYGVNNKILEKVAEINIELEDLSSFRSIHGDKKFSVLNQKVKAIREFNN